ncbi:MAG: DDE-type integrase/transposase/recombinase [Gammaproteobacteria bacterium]|nr:DDE-type integrase/transposase/recombinase [Gammaproteobacteria bacterium]
MAQLIRNSTWDVIGEYGKLAVGQYRVLEITPTLDLLIVFRLDNEQRMKRPSNVSLIEFEMGIKHEQIIEKNYPIPRAKLLGDAELPDTWKHRRDDKYALIAPLVEDDEFLRCLANSGRSQAIKPRALEVGVDEVAVYRALSEYWRYGQTTNALIPKYASCGGPGKARKSEKPSRGRPRKQPIFGFNVRIDRAVTEEDKKQIRRAIEIFYIKRNIKSLNKVYVKYLGKYHKSEVEKAALESRPPNVPTITQFRYWHKKQFNAVDDERKRVGKVSWDMNSRALLSGVSEHVSGPGDCYEIDATVADVYVVSKYNRSWVLGRPVIYVIVDEASRMVVGVFVDLVYASWSAAKQALLNAFLPKKEFCARYGILIEDEDWPCHHLPRGLLCDRGEMIGNMPEQHLAPMGIKLNFAAPKRADWKAVVERRFGIVNKEALHDLNGTTRGRPKGRMDPDPKKEALHTLDEVTKIIVKDFIGFNKTRFIDDLITPGLLAEDMEPTPLNFWRYHVSKHLDSLSIVDEDQARAELMRAERASITARGIRVGDLYYSCAEAERENWFALTRLHGEYSVDARIDDSNSSQIYIRRDIRSPLVRCTILPREKLYADLHRADVIWMAEWKRDKAEVGSSLLGRVRQADEVEKLREVALADRKNSIGSHSKTPNNITNLRETRCEEKRLAEVATAVEVRCISEENRSEADVATMSKLALIEQILSENER